MDRSRRLWLGLSMFLALRPAGATPEALREAIAGFAAGTPVQRGRITLEIAPLVENGNAVPISITVASPMTPQDHVREIALFTEQNPQLEVLHCRLSSHAGRAEVSTRIRLATSQQIVALARLSDGSCWQASADVVVTLAACVE
ncbi:SoxY-related AACIE arm protein [Paucibacter sp. PLA-PC-4]|uniref:SoxY-related AACIE arm protein n=1 Tax=Paucibacter sp. PLA-PC-4 TaxID=2993655 RepID=UPI00224ACDF5|nr:SoxY-related AACIE arm protein [Paucibacter sp. PLA-PC-4]MCX2864497.1 SoxY-related AACIE arm protein [Paucibacter sp. PLA-PC-4]